MRDFWILFKIGFINHFGINKLQKKFSNRSGFLRVGMPIIMVVLGLLLFAMVFFYVFMYASLFAMADQTENILLLGVAVGSIIVFFTTLSKANAFLFESRDYDLLMSLPVRPQSVIASKLAGLLSLNYVSFGFIFIPSFISYCIFASPGIFAYVLAFFVMLVAPLLLITICSIVAYFMGLLFAKFKYKNMLQTLGMLIFFVALMFFMMQANMAMDVSEDEQQALIDMVTNISRTLENIYPPAVWARDGILGDWLSYLVYVCISIIPFTAFIGIVGREFVRANARARKTYTDKNYQLTDSKAQSQTQALFKKEVRRYFSSSMVVLNTSVGPIMGTIMVLVLLFGSADLMDSIGQEGISNAFIVALLIGVSTFMNGIITITATSISLEGKYFWVIKSAPVRAEDVFISKILLNLVVTLPFTIINAVVIAIRVPSGIREIMMLLFIPIMVNLIIGTFGLYINLLVPKMDWVQEVRVVKQSMSVIIAMLFGMLLVAGLFILFVVLTAFGLTIAYFIISLVLIALLGGAILILTTDGKKRYYRLKA